MELNEEEKRQLKKIIEATGVVPPALQNYQQKNFKMDKEGPVILVLQDEKKDRKTFELVTVRKKSGLLGHELEVPMSLIINLVKISGLTPWIVQVVDDKEQIFPYYHGDDTKVIFSPTFFLVKNKSFIKGKVDPYNVPLAGFLFIYNPFTQKNYLEAVSGSVVGNVAVIENLMKKHGEIYSRRNHLLNWLAFLVSKDSKNCVIQAFSMHETFISKHKEFANNLEKKT